MSTAKWLFFEVTSLDGITSFRTVNEEVIDATNCNIITENMLTTANCILFDDNVIGWGHKVHNS